MGVFAVFILVLINAAEAIFGGFVFVLFFKVIRQGNFKI